MLVRKNTASCQRLCSIALLLLLCGQCLPSAAQLCKPDVFAVQYQGNAAYYAYQTIKTPQNEIVSVGNVLQVDGYGFAYDAWAYKLSARGTVLWAKRYMPAGYNSGAFDAITQLPDGGFLVSGGFAYLQRKFPTNEIEVLYTMTVICKLDQFGNLVWMKFFTPFKTLFKNVNALVTLPGGDALGSASIIGTDIQQQLLFRMDSNGNVKWCKSIKTQNAQTSSPFLKQLKNGQVLGGSWAYDASPGFTTISKQGFALFKLDPENGRLFWNFAYYFDTKPRSTFLSTSPVYQLTEMSDGGFNLFSSYSDSSSFILFPDTRNGLQLQLSSGGDIRRAIAYDIGRPGCSIIDAQKAENDSHLLLMNTVDAPMLAKVDRTGNILWQRTYGKMDGNLKANSIFSGLENLQIYFSGQRNVAMSALLQTEDNGALDCKETPSTLASRDVITQFTMERIAFTTEPFDSNLFEETLLGLNRKPYQLDPTKSCIVSCCTDVPSDTTSITFCNRPSYQLPNGSVVKETGLYYTQHKSSKGCDSLAFYNIRLDFSPKVSLGDDVCFNGKDSVVLQATDGFDQYNWMGTSRSDSTYTVRTPGLYWVGVSNRCGSAKDTIQVFRDCDFPVYMPDAFTPNGDGLNDVFRYPRLAKNFFVRLLVYNRWGQKVFETRDAARGWNGLVNGVLQPTSTYVYLLETKTLDGRKRQQSGTVNLIR